MNGNYIYGIVRSGEETPINMARVGSPNQVYAVPYQGLGAVVSNFAGKELSAISKEEVVRRLLAHQLVVEQVMKERTVLPMKFGTVVASLDEVRCLLVQGYQQFSDALDWAADKVEIEVAATWNLGQVLQEIGQEEKIVSFRQALAANPQQIVEGGVRLGQMVKASLDQRRDAYREQMIAFLRPLASDVQPNILVSDEMVMNVAFLIGKDLQEVFDSRVKQLDKMLNDKINFRVIGPLPPYSFATVEVTRPAADKIEEARQILGLGPVVSESEVRKSYRHLAAANHPDCKPGDEAAKMQFARLRQASDLLMSHCRAQVKLGDGLLLNIRRLGYQEAPHFQFAEPQRA